MSRRLLDVDGLTGLATWHDFDASSGRTAISYTQDVGPHLAANRRAEAAATEGGERMGDFVHVASIPASVQLAWLIEKGVDLLDPNHGQKVAQLLDDPEWRYLKVRNIVLGRV